MEEGNADYSVDMETRIHKGKKCRREGCYVPNSDRYDEDYVKFLEGLEEFWESKYKVDDDDDNVVDDDGDPLYLAFLNNLKEHGNAYMCGVIAEYGVLSPIVYEEEDSDSVPVKRKTPESHEDNRIGEKRNVGVVVNNSNAGIDYSGGVRGETTALGGTFKKKKVREKWGSSRDDFILQKDFSQSSSEVVADLNRSGARKVRFDVPKEKTATRGGNYETNRLSESWRSSQDDFIAQKDFPQWSSEGVACLNHSVTRKVVKGKTTARSSTFEKKKVGENWRSSQVDSIAQKDFPQRSSEAVAGVNHSVARKDHSDVFKRKTTSSRWGENGNVHLKGKQRSYSVYSSLEDQMSEEINETYKEFLDNLYNEEGFLVFKYGNNKQHYGSSDQRTTDEVEPPETDIRSPASPASTLREASPNPRPLKFPRIPSTTVSRPRPSTLEPSISIPRPSTPPSREKSSATNSHLLNTSTCKNKEKSYEKFSSFWKELHDDLRKPYEQEEYNELMHEVSVQRPIETHRDGRRGGTARFSGKLAKSYLQRYPDIDAEIKKLKSNRYKVLNLLRMFVFYLKKIPAGVPKPWQDNYSKTIMPGMVQVDSDVKRHRCS